MPAVAIHFDCPWCTQIISVDDSKAHERVECPYCNRPVKVPTKSTRDPPPLEAPPPLPYMEDPRRDCGYNFSMRQILMAIFRLALLLLVLLTMAGWIPQPLGVIIWTVLFIGSAATLLFTPQ